MYRECTYSFHTYIHVPCVHITSLYIYICSMHIYRYIPYLSPYLYTGIYPIHVYIQVYTLSLCIYTCSMYINTCPVSTYIHMPSIHILYICPHICRAQYTYSIHVHIPMLYRWRVNVQTYGLYI